MDPDDTSLRIQITAQDDATPVLEGVSESANAMAEQVGEAAEQMQSALSTASEQTDADLQALADAAMKTAEQWGGALDSMTAETVTAGENLAEALTAPMDAAGQQMLASLQAEGAALEEAIGQLGTMSAEEWDSTFGTLIGSEMGAEGAEAGTSFSSGFMGMFRYLMLGYFLNTFGSDITNAIQAAVSTAAGTPNLIASLQSQIGEQQADISSQEASLQHATGTTDQMAAAHQKVAAEVAAETVKIQELERQLQPLQAAYDQSKSSIDAYNQASLTLTTSWSGLQSAAGNTLLPTLTKYSNEINNVVLQVTAWVQQNPKLTQQILEVAEGFGLVAKGLGDFMIGLALAHIAWGLFGDDLKAVWAAGSAVVDGLIAMDPVTLAIAAAVLAVAAAVVLLIEYWPQIKTFLDYWNDKLGIMQTLKSIWDELGTIWNTEVVPALKQLYEALQPVMPYLEQMAEIFGMALLISLGIVVALIIGFTVAVALMVEGIIIAVAWIGTKFVEAWNWVINILTTVESWFVNIPQTIQTAITKAVAFLQPLITTLQNIINMISKIPGNILGGIGSAAGAVGNFIGSGIQALAEGGIVNGPTLALVGEAGPEAVIPLSSFTGGTSLAGGGSGAGSGNINIYVTGTFMSSSAARNMANVITTQLNRQTALRRI